MKGKKMQNNNTKSTIEIEVMEFCLNQFYFQNTQQPIPGDEANHLMKSIRLIQELKGEILDYLPN